MAALPNDRHERFCHEILSDPEGKAGRAYERSGYKARGAAADAAASRLLKDAKVAARLTELKDERSERTGVTLDEVVRGLYDEATSAKNPGSTRVQAWAWLGKHVGAFEADNAQKAPTVPTWVVVHSDSPPEGDG
jgi:phage terminase small subunit